MKTGRWSLMVQAGAIFIVALAPRLIGIGQFLTVDEKNWVGRGWEFIQALREFRFNDTLQTTHPGIPTLLVSGLSSTVTSSALERPFSSDDLRLYALASRVPLAVINSLLVVALFLSVRWLLPPLPSFLVGLVLALDPFLVAHSRLVHVDALLTGFLTLSILLLLRAEFVRSQTLLAWSAVAGGLAISAKLSALVLVPFVFLVLFSKARLWRRAQRLETLGGTSLWETRLGLLRLSVQWFTVVLATILLLWPGLLWVPDPVGNVKIIKRDLVVAVSTPHYRDDAYALDPLHYPATLLSRSTIPTLLGFIVLLAFLLRETVRRMRKRESLGAISVSSLGDLRARTLWLLLVFLVLFLGVMTAGAKKGDRYLLPAFPILDLLAVLGFWTLVTRLKPRFRIRTVAMVAGTLLVVPLLLDLIRLGPYTLAHYNRLFPPNLSEELGWGEGLDRVAAFLNGLPDDDRVAVASWYHPELQAFVRRPVFRLNAHEQPRIGYIVLYRNMFGRPQGHPANDFLDEYWRKQTPVYTAFVNGLPYAWVYRRPVYTSLVGELVPGRTVVAELPSSATPISGVEAFLVTYRGKADQGELVLRLRESLAGPDLRVARRPLTAKDDNRWVRFSFPPLEASQATVVALISAEGTRSGAAPSVRVAASDADAPRYGLARSPAEIPGTLDSRRGAGRLGLRLIY